MATPFQAEQEEERKKLTEAFAWHILAKQVADWTNDTFWNIMDKPAIAVFSIIMVMQATISINKSKQPNA